MPLTTNYLKKLKERGKESHVYQKYQLFGLEIAGILHDEKHKALYIKLAKEWGGDRLMKLAKGVAERKDVKNPGAYFMRVLASETATIGKTVAATKRTIVPKKPFQGNPYTNNRNA